MGKLTVAFVQLDFDQHTLINLLKKRGAALQAADDGRRAEREQEIKEKLAEPEYHERLTRPSTAIITFEYTQAVSLLKEMRTAVKAGEYRPSGPEADFQTRKALLPWNIMWEWRNWSYWDRIQSKIKMTVLIVSILVVIVFLIFYARSIV